MEFVTNYWYVLVLIVLVLVVFLVHRYLKGKAKTVALQYLLAAERMVFTTTESKLSVVSFVAYKALPAPIKAMISPLAFELLVTSAYDQVKELIDKLNADPSVPLQTTSGSPSSNQS